MVVQGVRVVLGWGVGVMLGLWVVLADVADGSAAISPLPTESKERSTLI